MTTTWITPPALAKSLNVASDKVIYWIMSDQLDAVNLAAKPDGIPRWKISSEALEKFLARRAASNCD